MFLLRWVDASLVVCLRMLNRDTLRRQGKPDDVPFWSDLLSISTRFLFDEVRESAISNLTGLATPVEKIYLAKKYDVPNWLQASYESLCKRPAPIELWEAERMGWDTSVLLAKAREKLRDERLRTPSPPPKHPAPRPASPLFSPGSSRPPSPSFGA